MVKQNTLSWIGIFRLGLVQTALGAIVVLTTSTLNRVMVVELALPAVLPGALVAMHYAIQVLRPKMGHSSDVGTRRTPWIIGGIVVLAAGGVVASLATALMAVHTVGGIALAIGAFIMIGLGVGAAGTSLLALLASRVDEHRRPAAATIVWLMMIAGFVVTAGLAGAFLDPFSFARMITVTAVTAACAVLLAVIAIWGVEPRQTHVEADVGASPTTAKRTHAKFNDAFIETWREPKARQFTVFVFVSMLAYSAQDLILEPFAGAVFGLTPGESTQLAGVQHGGVFLGMIFIALLGTRIAGKRANGLRNWCAGGCIASAAALAILAIGGLAGSQFPLREAVFALGFANGVFAVAAIGSMMALAGAGGPRREGIRMGLWGAAQAIAFGIGGFLGTAAIDLTRTLIAEVGLAYAMVFSAQALLFILSAYLAYHLGREQRVTPTFVQSVDLTQSPIAIEAPHR